MTQVIGIGLGRTGTRSLCHALEVLGYKKVVHCPATLSAIEEHDAAAEGACMRYWREPQFEDAKLILTVREPRSWVSSCCRAIHKYDWRRYEGTEWFNYMRANRISRYGWFAKSADEKDIESRLFQHYSQYHYDVAQFCLENNRELCVTNLVAGDGWARICPFLGIPKPNADFPNERDI